MKYFNVLFFYFTVCTLLFCSNTVRAQDLETEQDTTTLPAATSGKKFHLGLFVGTYFANKYTANMYDGYGFDVNGIKNDFANSQMRSFMNYYGGHSSNPSNSVNTGTTTGTDLIAQTLNVSPGDWSFGPTDMPYDLTYNMTYLVGFNGSYNLNKTSSIIFNVNGTKLTVNGKFTIATTNTVNGSPSQTNLRQGTITGGEQRLMFQVGYQKVLGTNDKVNFFMEGGLNVVMAKFLKNQALIQSSNPNVPPLIMDLASIYNTSQYNAFHGQLTGVGVGIFAGAGIHLTINPKYTIQVLYNPSYDKINLGDTPSYKLQNGFGLRFYYNL